MVQHRPGSHSHGHFAQATLLSLLASAGLVAQSDLLQIPPAAVHYRAEAWSATSGLPQNTVPAMVQTRLGPLWIATYGGLCRFDGEQFQVFDTVTGPGLRTNRLTSLHEGPDGTLWIGTEREGLARYRDGTFAHEEGLPRETIQTIATDASGRLLVAMAGALYRAEGTAFRELLPDQLQNVLRLLRRGSGELLAATATGLWRIEEDRAQLRAAGRAQCLAEVGERLFVGTHRGLYEWSHGQLVPWQSTPDLAQTVLTLCAASDQALWVGTDSLAIRLDAVALQQHGPVLPDPARLSLLRSPPSLQPTRSFCEDRNGGMWVGHTQRGVTRFRKAEIRHHATASGLPSRNLTSVLDDGDGNVLVGTSLGLMRGSAGRFTPVPGCAELGGCYGMLLDPDGVLWFATSRGLARLDDRGPEIWIPTELWSGAPTRAIVRDADGSYWLGSDHGPLQMRGRTLSSPPFAAEWRDQLVRSLALGPDGALWVGGASMLSRIAPDRATARTWHSGKELPFGEVRSILPEAGEHAWIATYGGGIVRIDGARCQAIDERHGLCDQSLCAMVSMEKDCYLASNRGVCVVRWSDLDALVAGTLDNLACRRILTDNQHAGECDGGMQPCASVINGHLWCCSIDGLLEMDPANLQPLRRSLPTTLQGMFLGDQPCTPSSTPTVVPNARVATFRLGTCDFDYYPQVRYRWRLLGAFDQWSNPSYSREVRFDALPPGELCFEAEAIDLDGSPSSQPVCLRLHVPTRLWETRGFWILLPLAGLAAAILLVRFGATRAALRALRLQRVVDERTSELRAAREQLEERVLARTRELEVALHSQHESMLEQQRLERQLQQMQRMESIGQLAGGIAHDFNNLLTVASGSSHLLEDEVHSADGKELCLSIRQACERGRRLTQHLLAVASRQLVQAARLDLNVVVRDLLPVLRALLGDDVPLDYEPAPEEAPVQAAVTQIEQILLNLAANARDAMPRGGRVTIRIHVANSRVHIELQDNGVGMPAAVKERVFEPFFTTKQHGGGRGLGLATVYGIVKQLDGEVHIDSAVDHGTTVRITLPCTTAAAIEPQVVIPNAPPHRLHGRILLIEDQPDVRTALLRLLRHLGCTVHATPDGDTAVALLRADPTAFDAVVSDVVMPGLQGRHLVQALREVQPGLPILFLSGDVAGRLTHQDLQAMGLQVLTKPVDSGELSRVLQQLLATAAAKPSPAS